MSALIGQPPNTEEDYWIVKGILTRFGLPGDPALGIAVPPVRPPDAHFENRGPRIIATNSVVIVLVILITGSRVLVRALHRGLKWGWDDWVIILASVSMYSARVENGDDGLTMSDVDRDRDLVLLGAWNGGARRRREAYLVPHLPRVFMV